MPRADAPPPSPAIVDATLDALAAWDPAAAGDLWPRLTPELATPLASGWEPAGRHGDPALCLERLRRRHRSQAAPDLSRIHPSWLQRALAEEPPTVAAAVAAHLPPPFGEMARTAMEGTSGPPLPAPDRAPHPGALAVALALWSHRLAGDEPPRDDDLPAIAALTLLDTATLSRLFREVGIHKWARVWPHRGAILPAALRDRIVAARRDTPPAAPAHLAAIEAEINGVSSSASHPELLPGLAAFGRLLGADDPQRVRWALQHIPYNVARQMRRSFLTDAASAPEILAGERTVLERAWRALDEAGQIDVPWRWNAPR